MKKQRSGLSKQITLLISIRGNLKLYSIYANPFFFLSGLVTPLASRSMDSLQLDHAHRLSCVPARLATIYLHHGQKIEDAHRLNHETSRTNARCETSNHEG